MMAICINLTKHGFPHQMIHLYRLKNFFPFSELIEKKYPKISQDRSSGKGNLFNKQKSSRVSSGDKI